MAAVQRGHQVDLYERDPQLGGQAKLAIYCDFKWNMRDYLNWMIHQAETCGASLYLGTEATPELLKAKGYDAIICAMGSRPKTLPIPDAEL